MTRILRRPPNQTSKVETPPIQELLADIRSRDGFRTDAGGFAVVRATFDRDAPPEQALYWLNGVGFEDEDNDDGRIVVVNHKFIGSGYYTNCGSVMCGMAVIDPRLDGEDSLVVAYGSLPNADEVGNSLQRMLDDDNAGNGNPMNSFLSRVVLVGFNMLEHDISGPSPALRAATQFMLDRAAALPDYYGEGLRHLQDAV